MAKTKSVEIQLKRILDEVSDDVNGILKTASYETAEECVDRLKVSSPEKTGDYARGWTTSTQKGGYVVHNATDYQLTHLLENGHVIVNKYGVQQRRNGGGDTTTPRRHIRPVERWGNKEFQRKVEEGLKDL